MEQTPDLRRSAAEKRRSLFASDPDHLTPADLRLLLQELQVYQRELETQHEELRLAQAGRALLHQQYVNLFELAPVGYCTLDEQGVVQQLNQRAHQLLGAEPGQRFTQLIPLANDQAGFLAFLRRVLQGEARQTCALQLQRPDGHPVAALLAGVRLPLGPGAGHCGLTLTNDTAHQAMQELAATEPQLRALFEDSADAAVLVQDQVFIDCNRAALAMMGATRREQVVGQPVTVCAPATPSDGQRPAAWFAENAETARPAGSVRREALLHCFTGEDIWVEGVLTPVEVPGQAPLTHISWRDVSERRLNEQRARESEVHLQTAIEAADMGIGIWNFSTQMFYVDARARRMFGLPPEGPELSFTELMAVVHPDDVPLAANALHQAAAGVGPLDVEVRVQHPDGTVRYVAANGQVMHSAEGSAVRMSGVLRDVTNAHEANARLTADTAFLQSLVSNVQEGILAFDADLRVTEWNYLMEHYLGVPRAAILGRPIFELLPALDQPAYHRILRRALAGETLTEYNLPFSFRAGVFDAAFVPLRDASGGVTGALGVIRDVTERNRLMEEATRARMQREKEVLSAIMHTQEDERKRIAEALHNGVGQLLYAAKLHLYNQPVDEAHRVAALGLLNEAIKATRTISFELTPNILEDFGLKTALEELCKRIPQQNLTLHLSVGELPAPLSRLLETAVYRIVQELLNNVIKHAQAREAFVYVEVQGRCLHASVEDDGTGFDVEAAVQKRAGIGLAGIRNRVSLLAGQLSIRSKPGRGTTISIELPLGPEDAEAAPPVPL